MAGSIPGSDYYIVGGITELNFNIRSENANGDGGGTATNATTGTVGGSIYVMNVGLDMRLVNTNTLEVVDVISYQKQIIGRQVSAGVFDFLGANFFDAQRRRKRAGADPAGGALGDRARRAGDGRPHLSRPGAACASPITRPTSAADPLARRPAALSTATAYPQPNPQPAISLSTRRTTMNLRAKTLIAATALTTLSARAPTRGLLSRTAPGTTALRRQAAARSSTARSRCRPSGRTSTATSTPSAAMPLSRAGRRQPGRHHHHEQHHREEQPDRGPERRHRLGRQCQRHQCRGAASASQNQAVCNGASVSTDPTSDRRHQQPAVPCRRPCVRRSTPTSPTWRAMSAIQGSSMGNSFEADTNAPNMPICEQPDQQRRWGFDVNANVYNVGGSISLSSSAIGNTAPDHPLLDQLRRASASARYSVGQTGESSGDRKGRV